MASQGNWDVLSSNAASKLGASNPENKDSDSEGFFGNKNIQQAMAQLGAGLDPKGAAGAIGGTASNLVSTQSQQNYMDQLIKSLGKGGKVKMSKDGGVEIQAGEAPQESEGQPQESQLSQMPASSQTAEDDDRYMGYVDGVLNEFDLLGGE